MGNMKGRTYAAMKSTWTFFHLSVFEYFLSKILKPVKISSVF